MTQAGAACTFTPSPTSLSTTSAGGALSFSLATQTGCSWTATSNASWLRVTSGATGNATATIGLTADPNTAGSSRTAVVTAGGQSVSVAQAAANCSFSASPTTASVASAASSATIAVTATASCNWTATSNAGWLTITSGASGSGNGSVGYTVAANTGTFKLTHGEVHHYVKTAESGRKRLHGLCTNCGTRIYAASVDEPCGHAAFAGRRLMVH